MDDPFGYIGGFYPIVKCPLTVSNVTHSIFSYLAAIKGGMVSPPIEPSVLYMKCLAAFNSGEVVRDKVQGIKMEMLKAQNANK